MKRKTENLAYALLHTQDEIGRLTRAGRKASRGPLIARGELTHLHILVSRLADSLTDSLTDALGRDTTRWRVRYV